MSTESERDIRAELIQANQRRSTIRFQETLAAVAAIALVIIAFLAGSDVALLNKQLLCYGAAALLVVAAFYNLYRKVVILPNVNRLQQELNDHAGN